MLCQIQSMIFYIRGWIGVYCKIIIRKNIVFFFLGVILINEKVYADMYFNPHFLDGDASALADLSAFEKGQELPPGIYRVDIYLNGNYINNQNIDFKSYNAKLVPCLTKKILNSMGVNTAIIQGDNEASPNICLSLSSVMKDASSRFDVSEQRLDINIPQAFLNKHARGYMPPEEWNNGITAALLNYNLTGSTISSEYGGNSNYNYLNLMSGLNAGAWRLRDNSAWSYSNAAGQQQNTWQHINTWLERDILAFHGRLTLGDGFTSGDLFDGFNFRGVKLESDDNMYPDSQKGFAPEIHGIAKGNADVTIQQNGYTIYQISVPSGAFVINDLYATGSSGDLKVIVKEADGSTHVSTVPFSSIPILQREGHTKYSFSAGKYRSGNDQQNEPDFIESNIIRGMQQGWTFFSGTQLAERYHAFTFGVGKNLGVFGAASLDVTQANSTLSDDSHHQGQSLRFLYSKSLNGYGTAVRLLGYRYSTQGFYTLSDTSYTHLNGYTELQPSISSDNTPVYVDYYNLSYNKRGMIQLSVSQQLGTRATLFISGSRQNYWKTDSVDEQIQSGINMSIEDINLAMNYSLMRNAWQGGREQLLSFNISVPFNHWMRSDSDSPWSHSRASTSISDDMNGNITTLSGVSGTLLPDNNLSYSMQTGISKGGTQNSMGNAYTTVSYQGSYGNANIGYSNNNGYKQTSYGVSGGILAHENGVTFSQPLNDTIVLVKAPGADNVKIDNQTGIHTDWHGYAVLPYASDYRENRISLNTDTLSDNVDLDDAVINVVPTHGAVVRANFKVRVGMKVLMTLKFKGKPVPFGAMVSAEQGQSTGIVADNGQVYLTGLALSGKVRAKWGSESTAQCVADYKLPSQSQTQPLARVTVTCQQG